MPNSVRSIYGIKVFKKRSRTLRELNRSVAAPTLHGNQLWGSSFLVMDYLVQHPLEHNLRVMDVGCGWGLLGIYCAKTFAAEVLMVDADDRVFPYNNSHTHLNEVSVTTCHARFSDLNAEQLTRQDVIVGADICFWPELATQLRALFTLALHSGVRRILLADPGRSTFRELAQFCRLNFGGKLYSRAIPGRNTIKGYVLDIQVS